MSSMMSYFFSGDDEALSSDLHLNLVSHEDEHILMSLDGEPEMLDNYNVQIGADEKFYDCKRLLFFISANIC